MTKLTRPVLLVTGFLALAALPAQGAGSYGTNDANRSGVDINTTPMTSDSNTVTEDTLILDEPLANDPLAGESMSAPPIAGDWDFEREAVAIDQNSELARNLKLHISKNSALSIAGQDVKLMQVGDQVVLDGRAANAAEANYINKLVNQFSKDQTVVNQLQLADETFVDDTMETF